MNQQLLTSLILLVVGAVVVWLNREINYCIIYFNAIRIYKEKQFIEKQAESTSKFTPLTNLYEALSYTIYENWAFSGIYIAYIYNAYVLSKGLNNYIELLTIYGIVVVCIIKDYMNHLGANRIYNKIMPYVCILTILYICARINNWNLISFLTQ